MVNLITSNPLKPFIKIIKIFCSLICFLTKINCKSKSHSVLPLYRATSFIGFRPELQSHRTIGTRFSQRKICLLENYFTYCWPARETVHECIIGIM